MGQNQKYYQRFPDDVEAVQKIVAHLIRQPEGGVRTPSGNLLTPRSLQLLGLSGACYLWSKAPITTCRIVCEPSLHVLNVGLEMSSCHCKHAQP